MSFNPVYFLKGPTGWEGHEDGWHGEILLGTGGQGSAGLFVKTDPATQVVLDRVVVKEAGYSGFGAEWMLLPSGRVPREVYMAQIMPENSNNTVKAYAFRDYPQHNRYRVYMEYCSLGDLHCLYKLHYVGPKFHVPEPYLWKLFEDLAQAAVALENPVGKDVTPGSHVMHMDLKPDNIFLSPPDHKHFPKYPIAKIGDFGGAVLVDPSDDLETHREKIQHESATTKTYVSPECALVLYPYQAFKVPKRDKHLFTTPKIPERCSGSANIWNIGVIIMELMSPDFIRWDDMQHFDAHGYQLREAWLEDIIQNKPQSLNYSKNLKTQVQNCLRFFPQERPSATKLLTRVRERMADHVAPMRTRECMRPIYSGQHELHEEMPRVDRFRVGLRKYAASATGKAKPRKSKPSTGPQKPKPPTGPHKPKPPGGGGGGVDEDGSWEKIPGVGGTAPLSFTPGEDVLDVRSPRETTASRGFVVGPGADREALEFFARRGNAPPPTLTSAPLPPFIPDLSFPASPRLSKYRG